MARLSPNTDRSHSHTQPDAWKIDGIATAQIISVALIVVAVVVFAIRHRSQPQIKVAEQG